MRDSNIKSMQAAGNNSEVSLFTSKSEGAKKKSGPDFGKSSTDELSRLFYTKVTNRSYIFISSDAECSEAVITFISHTLIFLFRFIIRSAV